MGQFSTQGEPLEVKGPDYGGEILNNVKRVRASDGSFNLEKGVLELRDQDGNVVIIMDPNG